MEPSQAKRKTRSKRIGLKDFIALEFTCSSGRAGRKGLKPEVSREATPEATPTGLRVDRVSAQLGALGKEATCNSLKAARR